MRALEYDSYGGIERLTLRDVPAPTADRGGVLVQVVCAALNPKDSIVRRGKFRLASGRRFPKRCGVDFAGRVVASDTPHFRMIAKYRPRVDLADRDGRTAYDIMSRKRDRALRDLAEQLAA